MYLNKKKSKIGHKKKRICLSSGKYVSVSLGRLWLSARWNSTDIL